MNDLVVQHVRTAAPAKGRLPNLDQHLEAKRLMENLGPSVMATRFPAMPAVDRTTPRAWQIENLRHNQAQIADALADAASAGVLAHFAETIVAALNAPPDHRVTMTALALLLDSRTKQPPNAAVYLDAATYDVMDEGFSPAVVVMACQKLRREATWLPEIAELLAACRAERDRLAQAAYRAERALKERTDLERYALVVFDQIAEISAQPETETDLMWSKRN